MPIGPSGEITAAPKPAPRNSRVGSHCRALRYTLPASKKVFRYIDWLIRAPASTVNAANDLPNASGLAWLPLADGSNPFGVMENSS